MSNDWNGHVLLQNTAPEMLPLTIELLDNQFGYQPFNATGSALHRLAGMLWAGGVPLLLSHNYLTVEANKNCHFQHTLESVDLKEWLKIAGPVDEIRAEKEKKVAHNMILSLIYELDSLALQHLIDWVFVPTSKAKQGDAFKCDEPTVGKMETIASLMEDRTGQSAEWIHTGHVFEDSTIKQYPWPVKNRSIIGNRQAMTLGLGRMTFDKEEKTITVGLEFVSNSKSLFIVNHNISDGKVVEINLHQMLKQHYEVDYGNSFPQAGRHPTHPLEDRS